MKNIKLSGTIYRLEVANTLADRAIGLSGRKNLDTDGMLFEYSADHTSAYTMSNTNFDLDIAFFDKNRKLLAVHHAQANDPRPVKPGFPYRYVIETPPDTVDWNQVEEFNYDW